MVLKCHRNSSGLTPENDLECLICRKTIRIHNNESKNLPRVSEVLLFLFEVLCKYMEWSPPLRYQFNFNYDVFPFCKECRSTLVTLYKSHKLLANAQKQINRVIANLCGKILLSQKDNNALNTGNSFTGSSQNSSSSSEEIPLKWEDKVSYFRDLVSRRYSASVRVTACIQPILLASQKIGVEAPEKCTAISEEADFDLKIAEYDDIETTGESLSNDEEAREDKSTESVGNLKRIVRCSEVSELLILNHRRVPKRNFVEKNDQGKSRPEILSEEVSSEVGQEDSDYEPSIASQKNKSLDDDGNFEEIPEPVVDDVKVRNHFEPGCGKFFDRVRNVGNDKYLFDEKYPFELNNQNKWVCSSCNHPYNAKTRLLEHLAKICKVASPKRRDKARRGRESDSDSADEMEEDSDNSDSSDYENVREFPLPQSFTGELPIPPLFVRRRKILKKGMHGTEDFVKAKHNLSKQHTDSKSAEKTIQLELKKNYSTIDSQITTALDLEERTKKVISNVALQSSSNSRFQDNVPDGPIPEGTGKNVTDEVQIRVESNVFQRQEFQNRIQMVGPSQYLLDDKVPFEFVKKKWRCIPCEVEYLQKDGIMQHFDFCPGNPPTDSVETLRFKKCIYDKLKSGIFRCRHCQHTSTSNDDAIVHMQRYHKAGSKNSGWVELELNKFLFDNKYPFEFTDDKFKCGTCPATFTIRGKILDHIRSKHIPEPEKKRLSTKNTTPDKFICNDKFSFEKVDDEYRCCECIYSSLKMETMKTHMRRKHINVNNFTCRTCGRKFATQSMLTLHEASHIAGRAFMCEMCGKSYKSKVGLKVHKGKDHLDSSEKKFSCNICDKAFRIQAELNLHSKKHERAICDVCGKHIGVTSLKEHVESHNIVKNHECNKCGKKFQHYTSLHVHLKCHDGVKPYSCDICDMKFTQQYSVTRHKNIAHNSNKPTKTYAKSRKRKRDEVSSEEETDEEKTEEEEEEASDGENDSSEETSEKGEA